MISAYFTRISTMDDRIRTDLIANYHYTARGVASVVYGWWLIQYRTKRQHVTHNIVVSCRLEKIERSPTLRYVKMLRSHMGSLCISAHTRGV